MSESLQCEGCGGDPETDSCICSECPVCGETGNPMCYHNHGMAFVIELQEGCWYRFEMSGEPGRTMDITHATKFHTRKHAQASMKMAGKFQTMPDRKIVSLHISDPDPKTRDGTAIRLYQTVYVENDDKSYWGDEDILTVTVESIIAGLGFRDYRGTATIAGKYIEFGNLDCYADEANLRAELNREQNMREMIDRSQAVEQVYPEPLNDAPALRIARVLQKKERYLMTSHQRMFITHQEVNYEVRFHTNHAVFIPPGFIGLGTTETHLIAVIDENVMMFDRATMSVESAINMFF